MNIEQEIQLQRDIRAIAELKATYCNCADGGWDRPSHNPEKVSALFIQDGVWDGGVFGRYEGREAIYGYFKDCQRFPLGYHFVGNPIIKVDGDSAKGNWHLMAALNIDDNKGIFIGGIYDDEFVRTPEGWRFKELKVTTAFYRIYEEEWSIGAPTG